MKRIAVLTSGGDGAGLNPCIRAVVRTAMEKSVEVMGIRWGYSGLIDSDMVELNARSVGGILNKGGTFIGSARSPEFVTKQGQREALRNLNRMNIDGLIVIGGNGSLTGALALHEMGFPVVGIPATIDNDVNGTDISIGVDTTLNTILDAVDKIKDTASSHQRAFLIEVMGRDSGYLALMASIAAGAEIVLIPEVETSMEEVVEGVDNAYVKGKSHCIIIIAEGWQPGARSLNDYLKEKREEIGFDVRLTVLGHVQRGGSPTSYDRILATNLGAAAVRQLLEGPHGVMTGMIKNTPSPTPLEKAVAFQKKLNLDLYGLWKTMTL
ncbi:MAG TPA: 6-phosphofructokinase [Desulfobacteraceae bacterium]|nr:6-phosphofructokinase [Desulfobacteraceae bacterium]HPJ67455.1 6-phosphofructokinase [Desulfobacteraceae bacterium]